MIFLSFLEERKAGSKMKRKRRLQCDSYLLRCYEREFGVSASAPSTRRLSLHKLNEHSFVAYLFVIFSFVFATNYVT